jgi:heme/copper-type cytochrome/quinol oxidase subunit 2
MWGIIAAVVISLIAGIITVGKEGMREYHTQSVWTDEEVDRVKGIYVFGWRLVTVVLLAVGILLFVYRYYLGNPEHTIGMGDVEMTRYVCLQAGCAMITFAVLAAGLLLYAHKNPKVYRIICMTKNEIGIKPTLAQKVSNGIDEMLDSTFDRKEDKIDAGYYGKYKEVLKNRDKK